MVESTSEGGDPDVSGGPGPSHRPEPVDPSGGPDRVDVLVTHDFGHPPERVFDAWLDPDLIAQWMFGPELRDEEIQGISIAQRVGGSFSFRVLRGNELLDHSGHYLEMERPHRLVFSWGVRQYLPESSTVYIDVEPMETPAGLGARLQLTHRLPEDAAEYAEQTRKGWRTMLRLLERKLG